MKEYNNPPNDLESFEFHMLIEDLNHVDLRVSWSYQRPVKFVWKDIDLGNQLCEVTSVKFFREHEVFINSWIRGIDELFTTDSLIYLPNLLTLQRYLICTVKLFF